MTTSRHVWIIQSHILVGRKEVPSSIDTRFDSSVNPILPLIASSEIGINSLSLGRIEGLEGGSTRKVVNLSVRIILTDSTVA